MKKQLITAVFAAALTLGTSAYADEVIYENTFDTEPSGNFTKQAIVGWDYGTLDKCVFEADVKFGGEGAGITLVNKDGTKQGTSIRAVMRNDVLTLAADGGTGSYYIYYIPIDTESWYHIRLKGQYGVSNASVDMDVDIYDENMQVTETKNYYLILPNEMYASSQIGPAAFRIEDNTTVDNLKTTRLDADELRINAPSTTLMVSSSADLSVNTYRGGELHETAVKAVYSVSGSGVTVDDDGHLTVGESASDFTVTAEYKGLNDSMDFKVISDKLFEIKEAVFNEDNTVLENIEVRKNYFSSDIASVVINVYSADKTLRDSFVKSIQCADIPNGDTKINIGYRTHGGFDTANDMIDIKIYSASGAAYPPENKLDVTETDELCALREVIEGLGGKVEWNGERRSVVGMINTNTFTVQADYAQGFINGEADDAGTVIIDERTFVKRSFLEKAVGFEF